MTDSHYSQLDRTGTKPTRNTVPFLKDVLKAKVVNWEGHLNGQWCYTEVRIVKGGNQWEMKYPTDTVYYQHVTVTDDHTTWEIATTLIDPTMPYEETKELKTWQLRYRGVVPSEYNVEGGPMEFLGE